MELLEKIIALSQIKITDDMSEKQIASAKIRNNYYANAFTAIHNGGSAPFNWSAAVITTYWLVYRRMNAASCLFNPFLWLIRLTIILIGVLSNFFKITPSQSDITTIIIIFFILVFLSCYIPGKFANKFYYHYLKKLTLKNYDSQFFNATNFKLAYRCAIFELALSYLGSIISIILICINSKRTQSHINTCIQIKLKKLKEHNQTK